MTSSSKKKTSRKVASKKKASATRSPTTKRIDKIIQLSEKTTIKNLTDTQTMLTEALQQHNEINIDLSKIQIIDTAALQLLLAFKLEADSLNKQLTWLTPSEAFQQAISILDLQNYFTHENEPQQANTVNLQV